MAKRQVLNTADTTSRWFYHTGDKMLVEMSVHNGGTWKLQFESAHQPGTWLDSDVMFTGTGQQIVEGSADTRYRLAGGTTGAVAYIADATYRQSVEYVGIEDS